MIVLFVLSAVLLRPLFGLTCQDSPLNTYPYCNWTLPIETRVKDLWNRLTDTEKVLIVNSDQGYKKIKHTIKSRKTSKQTKKHKTKKQVGFPVSEYQRLVRKNTMFPKTKKITLIK